MPEAWSDRDERQYEHIKESELSWGEPGERAEEIAARTVNKHRRQEGRTPNTQLSDLTRDELYNRVREKGIRGRSGMSKAELVAALS
ncbi:hypothetical protein DAETH_31420 [Deinococcus aetherius]|uniref:Rho termination factor N-terminal domain-containing protein n=1 Tax=Deinococcus aetherius TaxID=200252 RepID=A0ABM8AHE0_9DEIO|nr:addiction module toxin RelE [Deinococcus aetherius]BDP43173.1 hypothetical protein DAETH_31420 [Deinococcus aetherius]